MNNIFFVLILCLSLGLLLGCPAILLAKKLNLMDIPGSASHKIHTQPMPLAGGILLAMIVAITSIVYRHFLTHEMLGVLIAAAAIFCFGMWDDSKGLSAPSKLIGQTIAVIAVVSFGVQVHFIKALLDTNHISPLVVQVLDIAITSFWLIGITNAMNMIDSMDGIVAGLGVIASACFVGATLMSGQAVLSVWSAVILGISLSLYFWNRIASKFFLGDAGSQTIGFLLASFGILYNPLNFHPESSWFVPIMLLGVPIFDTSLVVFSRIRRKQPIGSGRRDHTYHRLIALGFTPKLAVFVTHLAALIVSCLAFFTLLLSPIFALSVFCLTIICGLAILSWLEQKPTLDGR